MTYTQVIAYSLLISAALIVGCEREVAAPAPAAAAPAQSDGDKVKIDLNLGKKGSMEYEKKD